MPEAILIDNDVVLKACTYRFHAEVVARLTRDATPPALLKVASFALRTQMAQSRRISDVKSACVALEELLAQVDLLVPTQDEIELAAELEERAIARSLEFDTGESQLVAVMLRRGAPLLVTGDKRAIAALAGISLAETDGRIACFEQLVAMILSVCPLAMMRCNVCAEPKADKAITACFACSGSAVTADDILAGLASYTNHLREHSGMTLVAEADLLTVVAQEDSIGLHHFRH